MTEDAAFNWPLAFFLASMFISIAAAVIGVSWVFGSTMKARASASREEAYKALAQECALAAGRTTEQLAATTDQLAKATTEIAELRTRTAELERMLKEV